VGRTQAGARRHFPLDANDLFQIFARERLDVVRSAISGSVMMVAGFELASTTSKPSAFSALQACVPE